jgi:hypothetical protein
LGAAAYATRASCSPSVNVVRNEAPR